MCKLKLFFSLINTIAIIAVCRIFGFSGMPNTYTFNIGADIVSLAICTVLLYSIIQDKECYGEHTRTFELLIFGMSFTLSSDAFFWLVQGVPELKLLNTVISVCHYTSTTVLIFFMFRYVMYELKLDKNGKFAVYASMIMNVLLIPVLLSCMVNLFYPLYFSIDEQGMYHRESLYVLGQTYWPVGLVIIIISLFISKVSLKDKLIITSFVMIPVLHQLITNYSHDISTECAFMLVSIVLIFGVIVARREQKLIKAEKELYESQISVMVSQIQPHFMYNALTSIAMMCTIDPDTAQEATVAFAKYLRGNMDSLKQKAPVPFSQELEHLKNYLYIEKLRFGDKLNIQYDIRAYNFLIPQLSVQPLVENAVKHGVGMKMQGGTVKIASIERENAYEVIISDDGVGFDTSAPPKQDNKSHVGMDNTRMRLREMCGGDVIIDSTVNEGTTATIILPKDGQKIENIMS